METIYKYPLEDMSGRYSLIMPSQSEILHVNIQRGVPCIWAKVNTENATEIRQFRLYGTGHPIKENNLYHHGTFLMQEGKFVFHLFEII